MLGKKKISIDADSLVIRKNRINLSNIKTTIEVDEQRLMIIQVRIDLMLGEIFPILGGMLIAW